MRHILKSNLTVFIVWISHAYGGSEVELVNIESFNVYGLEISTTNEVEMNTGNAKIPELWESFYNDHYGKTLNGTPVYGVYTNYESDVNGRMSVIAGTKIKEIDKGYTKVEIEAGKYLIFEKEGKSPEIVMQAWQDVWEYFSKESGEYKRAYTTDFEVYEGSNKVSIYVAVK